MDLQISKKEIAVIQANYELAKLESNNYKKEIENLNKKLMEYKSMEIDKILLEAKHKCEEQAQAHAKFIIDKNGDIHSKSKRMRFDSEFQDDFIPLESSSYKDSRDSKASEKHIKIEKSDIVIFDEKVPKYKNTLLCYHGKDCNFTNCYFAHSFDYIRVCPDGTQCNFSLCRAMFHTNEDREKFIEKNKYYQQRLCKQYMTSKKCDKVSCSYVHFYKYK